jgi:hypothetical protein
MAQPASFDLVGVIVVRMWMEGDTPTDFRARITAAAGSSPYRSVQTTTSVEETCTAVRSWIERIARPQPDADLGPV